MQLHALQHLGGLVENCWQDQTLPTSLPWCWGGEGARMLLCSWAGSVRSRCKSFLAGSVIQEALAG